MIRIISGLAVGAITRVGAVTVSGITRVGGLAISAIKFAEVSWVTWLDADGQTFLMSDGSTLEVKR